MMSNLAQALEEISPGHPWITRIVDAGPAQPAGPVADVWKRRHDVAELRRSLPGQEAAPAHLLDVRVSGRDIVLWTMRGGRFESVYPPQAFQPISRSLTPGLPVPPSVGGSHRIEFGSTGGRSSDGDLPMFLLADPDGAHGLWFAVGHSGRWRGSLTKEEGAAVHRLTIESPTVAVSAGDSLDLPRICVGIFKDDGWAAIRRFLAAECPRRLDPPVVYNTWFNLGAGLSERACLKAIEVAAEIGVEYVVLDAGWYDGAGSDFSGPGLGSWNVDRAKFPRGLEAVTSAAHERDIGVGLWFEPERANRDSEVARRHPKAFRVIDEGPSGVVDFGLEEARDWAVDTLDAAITRYGLDWLKWDCNVQELAKTWSDDARAELAHTRGVHSVLDEIRLRHPRLIIETCASGGNRIDIEMLARSHVATLSDQTQSPEIVRRYVGNASRLLPAQYRFCGFGPQVVWDQAGAPRTASQEPGGYPISWLVSVSAGTLGIHEAIGNWDVRTRHEARQHIERFKAVRPMLDGRFRVFADDRGGPLAAWEAWEFSSESGLDAMLLAFRQHALNATQEFAGAHDWTVTIPEPDGARIVTIGSSEGTPDVKPAAAKGDGRYTCRRS